MRGKFTRFHWAVLTAVAAAAGVVLAVLFWPTDRPPQQADQAFRFYRLNGEPTDLSSFRGQVVLVSVWATWCLSCREELPALARFQKTWNGPPIRIVALSIDRDGAEVVEPLLNSLGIVGLPVFLDPEGRSVKLFSISGLPTSILLDRDGRELGRWFGPKSWDEPATRREIASFLGAASPGKDP